MLEELRLEIRKRGYEAIPGYGTQAQADYNDLMRLYEQLENILKEAN